MALARTSHRQRCVHVDVVACKVERDKALEHNGPAGKRRGQEHQHARRRATVRHHVEDGAEARRLLKEPRQVAVQRIEEA